MAKLEVFDFKTGSIVGDVELPENINKFAENPEYLDFISNYLYRTKKVSFVKTAKTKTIGEIKGTTKKPFKQKGTGNARQGSLRSPQFRGGANIFGPVPITANYKINKKEVQLAKKILLSQLIEGSLLKVVESLEGFAKTKEFAIAKDAFLPNVRDVIFVDKAGLEKPDFYNAGKNIEGASFDLGLHFNIYRVSNHQMVVITKTAIKELLAKLFS